MPRVKSHNPIVRHRPFEISLKLFYNLYLLLFDPACVVVAILQAAAALWSVAVDTWRKQYLLRVIFT